MQPLAKMNPIEKAQLLFELFPLEIPALVIFIKYTADNLIADKDKIQAQWDETEEIFTFTFLISLAEKAKALIQEREIDLAQSKSHFSLLLFEGYLGFFSTDCLRDFIKSTKCTDYHFRIAAKLLFDFE